MQRPLVFGPSLLQARVDVGKEQYRIIAESRFYRGMRGGCEKSVQNAKNGTRVVLGWEFDFYCVFTP